MFSNLLPTPLTRWTRRTNSRPAQKRLRSHVLRNRLLSLEDRIAPTVNLGFEVEPNNTPATAQAVGGDIKVRGQTLLAGTDLDYFSFSAMAGDRVYAAVMTSDSAGGTDSTLTIFGTDGTTVLETDLDDGTLGATSSSIAGLTIPATGTYYAQVKGGTSFSTSLRPYDFYLRVRSGTPDAEVEPNDATPTPLPASGWVTGSTSAATDVDLYSVTLAAGDTVFLSLDLDPERDATTWNGRIGLGNFGAPASILVSGDASVTSPNSEAMFFTVKDAGSYNVFVDTQATTTFGTYGLSVSILPAAAGTKTTYASTDVPMAIADGPSITTSTINIPDAKRIGALRVAIELTHANMPDLDVELTSPGGNTVALFNDIGAAAQPGMNLVLAQDAAIPVGLFTIVSGLEFQPELAYRMEWFNGQLANGTWTLTIRDDLAANGGNLVNWSITVVEEAPLPPGMTTAIFAADFEANDGGFTHTGAQDEWEWGAPTFAPLNTANSGTNVWGTDLDATYNNSANNDLFSPDINLGSVPMGTDLEFSWSMKYHIESASFDRLYVQVEEVGGGGATKRVFEWIGASMNATVGNPSVTVNQSAGWGRYRVDIDEFAGKTIRLRWHMETDTSVQYAGVTIDDVAVTRFGTVEIPSASAKANNVTMTGTPVQTHQVTVTYEDNNLILGNTIKTGNIKVNGPNGFFAIPTLDAPVGDGMKVTATYTFTAADNDLVDAWDISDNGIYTIEHLATDPVTDNLNNPVPAGNIGSFTVQINGTYVVNMKGDAGVGSGNKGDLRYVLGKANSAAGADTIVFDAGVFNSPDTITLTGGELAVNDAVTIVGPGSKLLALKGGSRVMSINAPGQYTPISISGLTLREGTVTGNGAGILMDDDDVTLTDITVTQNTASVSGGGISMSNAAFGKLTLIDCTISNNTATGSHGGGIFMAGTLGGPDTNQFITLVRSTISGNTAGVDGGAAYLFGNGTFTMRDSTVDNNMSGGLAGGLYFFSNEVLIVNSTISSNKGGTSGGGIGAFSTTNLVVRNSTVAFNQATTGGNIHNSGTSTITLTSTIVSDGTATTGPDINGAVTTMTYSLVESDLNATLPADPTNQVNVDPALDPTLANNGGPTRTHALQATSTAIDGGDNLIVALTFDQRNNGTEGYKRLFDDAMKMNVGDGTDIGAFELQPAAAKVSSISINQGAAQRSMVTRIDVTFDSKVSFTGMIADAFTLINQTTSNAVTLSASLDGTGTIVTLTFTGGSVDLAGSLSDGRYTLSILASQFGGSGFDGNNNGLPGGNFVEVGTPTTGSKLFRLFGDGDGNGTVNTVDFNAFRGAFGGSDATFDFDGLGGVGIPDFNQFRSRFGSSV